MSNSRLYWRMAISEAKLANAYIFRANIPPPSVSSYNDAATSSVRSDTKEARHGYAILTMFWDSLTAIQASYIRGIIDNATDQRVYVTFRRNNAENGDSDWVDAYGEARMPEWNVASPMENKLLYENVELVLVNITAVNDPAVF